jgi:hypothetical protein
MFDFKEQNKVGLKGESLFVECYPELSAKKSEEDKRFDFLTGGGDKIEVKTDTYPMDKTENFFFEYFSDMQTQKLGGPWRAHQDRIDHFVYLFAQDRTFFWFHPGKLCVALEPIIATMRYKTVKNRAWTTTGFAVNRELVKDLVFRKDTF